MAESAEQTHYLETLASPSGGSGGYALEHLPDSNQNGPVGGDRGRQREQKQQQRAENCVDINTGKLWQMKSGQREVCPVLAAGNELSKCHNASQLHQKPEGLQAGDGNRNPRGKNDEDRPLQETLNQVQVDSLLIDSDTGIDSRLGKKRHRRRTSKKKRNWKPYNKLSWEEKKALEERETVRASRMREEMFAKGLPVAPYNTTQFLMDEHDREEPDLNTETGVKRSLSVVGRMEDTGSEEDLFDNEEDEDDDGSGGGSDGIGRPGNAGGEFLQRDFSETYEMYHVESLQNMTKQELVQEYLELEKCMSRLEEENNRLRRAVEPGAASESSQVRLKEMELEVERLRAENSELLLKGQLSRDRGHVATK
ncbi:protein HEXIM1 [Melanotaenia boesemani]|uniref:protein HEXIM1 n=1 Tax=Melanotaenia boesemani TaxID=1250792 RepID=UPI001C03FB52|nr:protein HEXIM1 [Melanotaenia boesemani]